MSDNPPPAARPQPPKPSEMCVCGRARHVPNRACPNPQPAGRHRPAASDRVATAIQSARRAIRVNRERAAHHDNQEPA